MSSVKRKRSKTKGEISQLDASNHANINTNKRVKERDTEERTKQFNVFYRGLVATARGEAPAATVPIAIGCDFDPGSKAFFTSTVEQKIELVDIFKFYSRESDRLPKPVSFGNFGSFIGLPVAKTNIQRWIKEYDKMKKALSPLSEGTKNIVKHKHRVLDEALLMWLMDERSNNLSVAGSAIKEPGERSCTVLLERPDSSDTLLHGIKPIFSASWVSSGECHNEIVRAKMQGGAGSVDAEAIHEQLRAIRDICDKYDLDDIYSCDECGMYLIDLDLMSYTTMEKLQNLKCTMENRVSILFCVNATGSSIWKAKPKPASSNANERTALRPLVIGTLIPERYVETHRMCTETTKSGWMKASVFRQWLRDFDDQLERDSLLIIDSAPSHGDPKDDEWRDPNVENPTPWKHLKIVRLPQNSASIIHPLDAECISMFKMKYGQLLHRHASILRATSGEQHLSRRTQWSLIPYAWSHVTAAAIRSSFLNTNILSEEQADKLRQYQPTRPELARRPTARPLSHKSWENIMVYVRNLVAKVLGQDIVHIAVDDQRPDQVYEEEKLLKELELDPISEEDWKPTQQLFENDGVLSPAESEACFEIFRKWGKSNNPVYQHLGRIVATSHRVAARFRK